MKININKNINLDSLRVLQLPLTKPLENRWAEFMTSDSASSKMTKVILLTIGIAGFLVVSATMPNLFKVIGQLCPGFRKENRRKFNSTFARIKKYGYVEFLSENDREITIKLTKKGEQQIIKYAFDDIQIKKPRKWNGKFHVIIFDIPNKYRDARNAFREKLQELGAYQLQKSVWVHPYPCFDEILFITSCFSIDHCVDILVVEEFRNHAKVRAFFKL